MNIQKIKIPGFPEVDQKQIDKYLQNDLDDDWYQDPVRYKDFIHLRKEIETITYNAKENLGRYKPVRRELHFVPKANFTLRYSLETDYYERWFYFYLVQPLFKRFDCLLPLQIYSHRYNKFDDRYLLHNSIQQWSKFEGIVRNRAQNRVIVIADIQNYYENIYIYQLKNDLESCLRQTAISLDEMKEMSESINCLTDCLNAWSYDGKRGIPQNRDCSSFLANIYMLDIDNVMLNAGYEYYRYMDDIKIICSDVFIARKALRLLVNTLRDKMLSVNSKKTKIIEIGSTEHNEVLNPNFRLKSIDLLLRTKRKANVAIGYNLLKELLIEKINSKEYDTKDFRFCISRMSKLARCKDYTTPDGYFENITDGIVESLVSCPTSTDRAYEYLCSVSLSEEHAGKIVDYLLDKNKSIYEWQNYWLWKLLVIHDINNTRIIDYSIKILGESEIHDAEKAGAILYLAKFGNIEQILSIRDFVDLSQGIFLQRHMILAFKHLDWKKHVEQVSKKINPRLHGTYKTIKNHISEIIIPPSPTNIYDLLETIHQYD